MRAVRAALAWAALLLLVAWAWQGYLGQAGVQIWLLGARLC